MEQKVWHQGPVDPNLASQTAPFIATNDITFVITIDIIMDCNNAAAVIINDIVGAVVALIITAADAIVNKHINPSCPYLSIHSSPRVQAILVASPCWAATRLIWGVFGHLSNWAYATFTAISTSYSTKFVVIAEIEFVIAWSFSIF